MTPSSPNAISFSRQNWRSSLRARNLASETYNNISDIPRAPFRPEDIMYAVTTLFGTSEIQPPSYFSNVIDPQIETETMHSAKTDSAGSMCSVRLPDDMTRRTRCKLGFASPDSKYGKAEPMSLVLDRYIGGVYSEEYSPENALDPSADSVYCSSASSCILVLRHRSRQPMSVQSITVRAPLSTSYTNPVHHGIAYFFVGKDAGPLLDYLCLKGSSETDSAADLRALSQDLREVVSTACPFEITDTSRKCKVECDPFRTATHIVIMCFDKTGKIDASVDIESIKVSGIFGPHRAADLMLM
ncbi:hypothetical protein CANCADRAFT_45670 [Tortispora caseinolytica NRRL Y-17796]|uniref:Uncharacterized protein n=1 Tax=Tortispora caseinolytica NRRL Y-17796 TaxID=767744 RepID=A0A1E4TBS8_9ASCO|nr:hypothetical protein CANCADRAFT_45670 [Tortispora caseinolytica NRRL Y-17796]